MEMTSRQPRTLHEKKNSRSKNVGGRIDYVGRGNFKILSTGVLRWHGTHGGFWSNFKKNQGITGKIDMGGGVFRAIKKSSGLKRPEWRRSPTKDREEKSCRGGKLRHGVKEQNNKGRGRGKRGL